MIANMYLTKEVFYVVVFFVVSNGSGFKLFDAEPLLKGSPPINLTGAELEELLNIDPGGEYTTMKFQYEHDQYLGQFDGNDKGERCYNDHVRCLTSITSASRPVCGTDGDGTLSDFGSLCDMYLDNCKKGKTVWAVIDNGNCTRANKVFIYDFNEDVTVKPKLGYP